MCPMRIADCERVCRKTGRAAMEYDRVMFGPGVIAIAFDQPEIGGPDQSTPQERYRSTIWRIGVTCDRACLRQALGR
jgi:hypothetical protein